MNLNRAYQWSTLLLALLGILSYAAAAQQTAQGAPVVLVWALPALCTGWYLSAARGFVLPRAAVNALLAGALAYAGLQAAISAVDVARIAELVIFLLIIKVGDRRSPRDDGQVISLAVFLAIAALLTGNSLIVGLMLLLFLPLLVMTVMLFQLQAGWIAVHARVAGAAGAPAPRWAAIVAPRLGGLLRRTVGVATFSILACSLFVFIILPRGVGENYFGNFASLPRAGSAAGFTDHVTLGDRGVISENPAVVFTVEIRSAAGDNLGSNDRVYYLRGAALDRYEPDTYRWKALPHPNTSHEVEPDDSGTRIPVTKDNGAPLIVQVVHLPDVSGRQRTRLFAMWKPVRISVARRVWLDTSGDDKTLATDRPSQPRGREFSSGPFTYTVESTLSDPAVENPTSRTPASFPSQLVHDRAARILRDAGLDPDSATRHVDDDAPAARRIQDYLRTNYAYTTVENPLPDDRTDPVEYFLDQSRAGHCEYFAAAMTALCRSVGINARMIAGYVAAEYIEGSGHYIVRQSNAHAWVEAEAAPGVWRRYDPTPPADLLRLHRPAPGLFTRIRQAFNAVEYTWNQSIVGFDESAREKLWAPAGEPGRALAASLEGLGERVRYGGVRLVWVAFLRGLLVFSAVAALGFAITILSRFRAGARHRHARPRDPASLRFYRTLLSTLRRRGLAKPLWRPPLDHTAALVDPEISTDAAALVRLYYRARFGGDLPTRTELADARARLNRIRRRPRPVR